MSFHNMKKYGRVMNSNYKNGLPDCGCRTLMWKGEGRKGGKKSKLTKKNGGKTAHR